VTTVDSISVGRFDQNLAVQRIYPPPRAAQLAAIYTPDAAGGMCPVRAIFSPWEPVDVCI
jgi:hypothetical protein